MALPLLVLFALGKFGTAFPETVLSRLPTMTCPDRPWKGHTDLSRWLARQKGLRIA